MNTRMCAGVLAVLICCACATTTQSAAPVVAPDSVVLERTRCFGTCPAYRLSIARGGLVQFQSHNPGETLEVHDTVPATVLDSLGRAAERLGFAMLPDTVATDRVLCKDLATDHPTIVVGVFGAQSKQVVYYTGCFTVCCEHTRARALRELANFARSIDTITRASRWIRPGRYR